MTIRTRVIKRRPIVNWRDPCDVVGTIAGAIGIAVLIGIFAGWL